VTCSRFLVGLTALLLGCTISPVPSPPVDQPDLDEDGLGINNPETEVDLDSYVTITAAPGTVDPAEGVVVLTNLDTTDLPSQVAVRDDGSFSIAVVAEGLQVLRLQVLGAETRSEPVDLALDANASGFSVVTPVLECLQIEPARWVGLESAEDSRSIALRNECDETVQIDPPALRRGQAGFSFAATSALEIEPGETTFITVNANGVGAEIEDVLLLDIVAPEPERRALTISIP
jgi:hypothetical protein